MYTANSIHHNILSQQPKNKPIFLKGIRKDKHAGQLSKGLTYITAESKKILLSICWPIISVEFASHQKKDVMLALWLASVSRSSC